MFVANSYVYVVEMTPWESKNPYWWVAKYRTLDDYEDEAAELPGWWLVMGKRRSMLVQESN